MKKSSIFLTLALCLVANGVAAATFTNLHAFSQDDFPPGANPQRTNSDGIGPNGYVLSGNTIYGTASSGGMYGYGTVFRVNTDGTHFTNLYNFDRGAYDPGTGKYPSNVGATPNPGLVLIDNTLYGTTSFGGPVIAGNIFRINTDGSAFASMYSFGYTNGQTPLHGLTLYSNLLYGTTVLGGSNGYGNVFTIDPSNSVVSFVYQFTNEVDSQGVAVRSDGIYGFGRWGQSQKGLVYKLGGGYTILYTFDGTNGSLPECIPVISGNTMFGVTSFGGTNGSGNVFRINTDGSSFTNLYNFTPNGGANADGSGVYNYTGLVLSGNTLYGTASGGGSGGQGTVWQINTDGSGFKVLHSFTYPQGGNPEDLVLSGGTLYGGTFWGVQGLSTGVGAVFAMTLQPTLNLTSITNRAVLTWNDPTFSLYTSTNITGTFTNLPGSHSPYTNIISGPQRFFRLQGN